MELSKYICQGCKGEMQFDPKDQSLKCPFCGATQTISDNQATIFEFDLASYAEQFENSATYLEVKTAICQNCSGELTIEPDKTNVTCIYCGSQVIADKKPHKVMDPQYLLPFKLEKRQAAELFRTWIQKVWFAPNTLKQRAKIDSPLVGVYFPFWTFDAKTDSNYLGERGIDHLETYQTKDAQGNLVERTKTVTIWHHVSGQVKLNFDDLLIPGSNALSSQLTRKLDEWDLENLLPYRNDYLAGHHGETYTRDLNQCYAEATQMMKREIEREIRQDIGGNHQRIHQVNTEFFEVTFKYLLLPIWVLVYKYNQKYYKVLINGRTGEIEGERPYSAVKIIFLSLIVIALVIWLYIRYNR